MIQFVIIIYKINFFAVYIIVVTPPIMSFLVTAPIGMAANVVKKGVKTAAHTALAAGKMAAKGAFTATKMAAKGALAAGEMVATTAVAAGKNAIHNAEDAVKSKTSVSGSVSGSGSGSGSTDNTGTPWPTNDRISGGDIETLVAKMYPDLKECLCNSMAKMFTDSSPKLTNVVIAEVENTLKTNPEIRAHIEKRITLITDDVLKVDKTKELIIKSLTTECKTNVNPALPNSTNNQGAVFARTNGGKGQTPKVALHPEKFGQRDEVLPTTNFLGSRRLPEKFGTRKNLMMKHRIPIRNSKNTVTRRFIRYKHDIDHGKDATVPTWNMSPTTTKKNFHHKNRTGKLPRMK